MTGPIDRRSSAREPSTHDARLKRRGGPHGPYRVSCDGRLPDGDTASRNGLGRRSGNSGTPGVPSFPELEGDGLDEVVRAEMLATAVAVGIAAGLAAPAAPAVAAGIVGSAAAAAAITLIDKHMLAQDESDHLSSGADLDAGIREGAHRNIAWREGNPDDGFRIDRGARSRA